MKKPLGRPGHYVPLDERIARYTLETTNNDFVFRDPSEIDEDRNLFSRPFNFYGGYVQLSEQDALRFVED